MWCANSCIGYLGPKGSAGAPFSAEGPGLDTEALFTCPFPPDPAEVPRVTSDTAVAKLMRERVFVVAVVAEQYGKTLHLN